MTYAAERGPDPSKTKQMMETTEMRTQRNSGENEVCDLIRSHDIRRHRYVQGPLVEVG
jgi:hypothetical protein